MMARNRIADATNALSSHFEFARMEAARRGNTVSVCRSADADAVNPGCSSAINGTFDGNDWASGWIVFEKSGGADTTNFEAGDRLLLRHLPAIAGTRVMLHRDAAAPQRLAFPPRGTGPTLGSSTFGIDYGTPSAAVAFRPLGGITLSNAGRCIAVALLLGTARHSKAVAGACV
jgi:hypothetical protein